MPFCTSCGHQNADEARFCNGCGQPMPSPAGTATAERPGAGVAPPPPPDNVVRRTPTYGPPPRAQQPPPRPQQPPPTYQQPPPGYQQQHGYPQPYRSPKDKTTATLLAWVFWPALDFYLGNAGKGVAKLLTLGGLGVWALIDAIKLLSMSQQEFDWRYNS